MKSRSYIWIFIALLILSGVLILVNDKWSTTGSDFESLLIEDAEDIDLIYVISPLDTLEFQRVDSKWKYGREELNQGAVENLLLASGRLSMTSIHSIDEITDPEYIMELIFMKGKREETHFYFARTRDDYYLFSKNSEEGFGIELKGFETMPLEKIFSDELDHYRMHLLLGLLPSEVQCIEIVPLNGSAFKAEQDAEFNIQVTNLKGDVDLTALVDERKMRLLFSYFNSIRYNEIKDERSIENRSPAARIRVTDFAGNKNSIDVFQWIKPEQETPDLFEALIVFNEQAEVLTVNYIYLDLLMRGLENYLIEQTD